jgi:hypothetical protein
MRVTPDKLIALALRYWNGSKLVDGNNKDILTGRFVRKAKPMSKPRLVPIREYGQVIGYIDL